MSVTIFQIVDIVKENSIVKTFILSDFSRYNIKNKPCIFSKKLYNLIPTQLQNYLKQCNDRYASKKNIC